MCVIPGMATRYGNMIFEYQWIFSDRTQQHALYSKIMMYVLSDIQGGCVALWNIFYCMIFLVIIFTALINVSV